MKIKLLMLAYVLILSSCSVLNFRKKTGDSIEINKGKIVQVNKVADYTVSKNKVEGMFKKTYSETPTKTDIDYAKKMALGNAVFTSNSDFLVNPLYDVLVTGTTVEVKVIGYPAIYTTFITMEEKDTVVVENRVVVHTSQPLEPSSAHITTQTKKKVRKKRTKMNPANGLYLTAGIANPIGDYGTGFSGLSSAELSGVPPYGGEAFGLYFSAGYKWYRKKSYLGGRFNFGLENEYAFIASDNSFGELRLGPSLSVKISEKSNLDFGFLMVVALGKKEVSYSSITTKTTRFDTYEEETSGYISNQDFVNTGSVFKVDFRRKRSMFSISYRMGTEFFINYGSVDTESYRDDNNNFRFSESESYFRAPYEASVNRFIFTYGFCF